MFANYSLSTIVTVALLISIVAVVGALFTQIGPWYIGLKKPDWQPPDWLFAPAWTLIFILTGYAAIDSYTNAPEAARKAVIVVFAINAVLNVLWSFCFFTLKSPMLALYEVVLLWLSIVSIMVVIAPFSPYGALALLAYLAWVSFAAFLNFTVVKLNGPGVTR